MRASHCSGFSCCGQASVVVACGLSSCGLQALEHRLSSCGVLVAQQHVGSSRTRARTLVPCIGRWILNHCATRGSPKGFSLKHKCTAADLRTNPTSLAFPFWKVQMVLGIAGDCFSSPGYNMCSPSLPRWQHKDRKGTSDNRSTQGLAASHVI